MLTIRLQQLHRGLDQGRLQEFTLLNRVDINDGPFLQIWYVLYFRLILEHSARSSIDFSMKQDGCAQAEKYGPGAWLDASIFRLASS